MNAEMEGEKHKLGELNFLQQLIWFVGIIFFIEEGVRKGEGGWCVVTCC